MQLINVKVTFVSIALKTAVNFDTVANYQRIAAAVCEWH